MFSRAFWRRIKPSPALVIVLSTALCLRGALILYALSHFGPAWFFSRGSEMGLLADSFLHGHGLSSPFGPATGPTAIVAPGYPLLVAAVFRVLGSYTRSAALCLLFFQAGCNTVTVYLVYRLSRALASERTACLVGIFWACSPPLLWMPTIFWDTSISCMLLIGFISVMLKVQQQRSGWFWFACGALCGMAGLFNPALLPSFLVLAAYTLFRTSWSAGRGRTLAARVAACLAGLALVFSPWPIRNARVFHACVLTRTTVGLELWMGNHPGATGFLEPSLFPTYNKTELAEYRGQGEMAYTAHKGELARAFIHAHPLGFALLSGQRFLRFWTGSGTRPGSALFSLHAVCSTLLGGWGFVLLWRLRDKSTFYSVAIPLLLFPFPYYITHAEFRYRLVLDPVLSALAAPALQWLLAKLHARTATATHGVAGLLSEAAQ